MRNANKYIFTLTVAVYQHYDSVIYHNLDLVVCGLAVFQLKKGESVAVTGH